ncbi:MAG: Rdx family protein [Acidobacteria bacterium]|nr:Rdx family protein [Acidobacteriota bacterium]MBV9477846.1 Rdx family protein [Acidobacteriota bacterium]
MPRASSLAAEIKKTLGYDSEIVRGSGGIFVVTVDNRVLFSKKEEGRFPRESEIIEKIREIQS